MSHNPHLQYKLKLKCHRKCHRNLGEKNPGFAAYVNLVLQIDALVLQDISELKNYKVIERLGSDNGSSWKILLQISGCR